MPDKVAYIIGDIHGCFQELLELEAKIKEHAKKHQWSPYIVCVGDLIDRGPDSNKVVEHFLRGKNAGTHTVITGNHECEFLRLIQAFHPNLWTSDSPWPFYLHTIKEDFDRNHLSASQFDSFEGYREILYISWLNQGGSETLSSYFCESEKIPEWKFPQEHVEFLSSLPLYWENSNMIVTHALAQSQDYKLIVRASKAELSKNGFVLERDLEDTESLKPAEVRQSAISLIWNRFPPVNRLHPHKTHISGHTPLDHARVSKGLGFIQLDTGCVYGKRLTSWCQKTETFLHVESETSWNRPVSF